MMYKDTDFELIMFYNTENFFSADPKPVFRNAPSISGLKNWNSYRYNNKVFKTAHVFKLIEEQESKLPMIIGLSEIQNGQVLEDLIKSEPFNSNYSYIHYDSLDERGVDVAMLYDKRKIEVIHSEPISFFFEIEDNDPANYDTTRDLLWCKLKYGDEVINFFVCHLPSKRENDINKPKRQYIIKELKQRLVDLIINKKETAIVCGDFNENPDEDNVKLLLTDDSGQPFLSNPYLELFKNQKFTTFHDKDGLVFDQIFFSGKFFSGSSKLQFQKAEIFNSEKLSNWDKKFQGRPFRTYAGTRYLGGYSDHFPVYVKLISTRTN